MNGYPLDDTVLVIAIDGHSNPSFGRRLVEFVEDIDAPKLVVCLQRIDPDDFTTDELRDFGEFIKKRESEREHPTDDDDDIASVSLRPLLGFASEQAQLYERDIRIVCDDHDLFDLLPSDLVTRSVMDALNSLSTA